MNTIPTSNAQRVFKKALKLSVIAMIVYAIAGALIGYFWLGMPGLWSFVIGAVITLCFSGLTVASILIASRFDVGGFFGTVLGTWLIKLVLLIVTLFFLKDQPFIDNLAIFIALVCAIVITLSIDTWAVLSGRIPTVEIPNQE